MADPLHIGQPLPDLAVQAADGKATFVRVHLGSQSTLLSFLHGTWCAECVSHLYSLRQHRPQIVAAGADVVVITLDKPEALAAFLASAVPPLGYTVLADPDHSAHEKAGVGQDTMSLVVDVNGIVRWLASWSDHRSHPGYAVIVNALRGVME
jgi:peroxiredoxin